MGIANKHCQRELFLPMLKHSYNPGYNIDKTPQCTLIAAIMDVWGIALFERQWCRDQCSPKVPKLMFYIMFTMIESTTGEDKTSTYDVPACVHILSGIFYDNELFA